MLDTVRSSCNFRVRLRRVAAGCPRGLGRRPRGDARRDVGTLTRRARRLPADVPSGQEVSTSMYLLLLYVHIVCAVIWVGGAFFSQLLALRVARSTDPADLPKLGRNMEFLGMRVFLPAS